MFYAYILRSNKSGKNYIGVTNDLRRRVQEHNNGNGGIYTKKYRPFVLIYYEAFLNKNDASKAEKFYKSGYGREVLKGKLENYFKAS